MSDDGLQFVKLCIQGDFLASMSESISQLTF